MKAQDTKQAQPTVAIVCCNAYPLFDPAVSTHVGGMETRSVLFAKALAKNRRWNTVFAVSDFGQEKSKMVDDIRLVVYHPFFERIRNNVARRFYKHWWRPVIHLDKRDIDFVWQLPIYLAMCLFPAGVLNRFWKSLKADVVCCFGNNPTSSEVIADCFRDGIKTVLCIASDDDLSADYRPGNRHLNDYGTPRWMAWYAVNTADYIMVQTERQQTLLERNFNRTGTLIHNPVPIPVDARQSWPLRAAREFVLWVGRSDTFHKRPLLVLDLARACPHIEFMMIVNKTNRKVFENLQRERPANVTIVERVPHHEMAEYYRHARLMISTSAYEGFPNTFLQAAVAGVPVVSLNVDPEDILIKEGCGICAGGDFGLFVQAVVALWSDNVQSENYAEAFFDYVVDNHGLERQILRFEDLLGQAISGQTVMRAPGCWRRPFSRFLPRPRSDG